MIAAAEVVTGLGTIVPSLPATESQARPLTRLEPEEQIAAWQEAVETEPNGKVTAAHVERVVQEFRPIGTLEVRPPVWMTPFVRSEPKKDGRRVGPTPAEWYKRLVVAFVGWQFGRAAGSTSVRGYESLEAIAGDNPTLAPTLAEAAGAAILINPLARDA